MGADAAVSFVSEFDCSVVKGNDFFDKIEPETRAFLARIRSLKRVKFIKDFFHGIIWNTTPLINDFYL